jgi:hypothetical protein
MNNKALLAMERLALLLAVAATIAAALAWGVEGAGAAALGGAVAFANLTVTRRLAGRAISKVLAGTHPAAAGLGAGMMIKMVLLFPILWVAVSVLHVPPVPFAVGLSVMIVSLVVVGLWTSTRGELV